jgi:hypothetical protein
MTEFDDLLRDALRREASTIEVSRRHAERILDRAAELPGVNSRREKLYVRYGRSRTLVGATFALLLLAAVVGPLTAHESGSTNVSTASGTNLALSGISSDQKSAYLAPTLGSGAQEVQGLAFQTVRLSATAASSHGVPAGSSHNSFLKIEQDGTVNLVVAGERLPAVVDRLGAIAIGLGGVVSNSQSSISRRDHGANSSGYVVLEVPAAKFTNLISQVRELGRATSVQTSATDVTSQYSDLAARIHANEVSRTQYLTIMAQAHTIGAILSVQNQIDAIQTRIDQLQGQLNVLSHEVTFSTLTVYVGTPTHQVIHVSAARTGFSKAWHDAISGFLVGFQWVLRVLGPLAFVAVLLGALALIVRFARRVRGSRDRSMVP